MRERWAFGASATPSPGLAYTVLSVMRALTEMLAVIPDA